MAQKAQVRQLVKLRRRAQESVTPSDSTEASSSSSSDSDGLAVISLRNESSTRSFKQPSVSRALGPSLETQGIQYFLANYVISDQGLCSGHMQNLLSWKTAQSKTLQVAMGAVGLAGLSNRRSDPILLAKARREYALALRMTQSHLLDSAHCNQDRTITAVALLELFEVRSIHRRVAFHILIQTYRL